MKKLFSVGAFSTMTKSLSAIAILLLACSSARATLITVTTTGPDGTTTQTIAGGSVTTLPDGVTQEWRGTATQAGSYSMQFDLVFDPDPSIAGSIALTNVAASTQTFTLNVSQPITSVPAGSSIFGASAISVSDANNSGGATVSAPTGSAIYTAFVNSNVTQKMLFVDPYSKSASSIGGVAVDSQSFSTGTTTVPATIMGIQHSFTLTAGDSATMNSTFTITVPEPCTLALAAIGGLGLVAVRRSRRK